MWMRAAGSWGKSGGGFAHAVKDNSYSLVRINGKSIVSPQYARKLRATSIPDVVGVYILHESTQIRVCTMVVAHPQRQVSLLFLTHIFHKLSPAWMYAFTFKKLHLPNYWVNSALVHSCILTILTLSNIWYLSSASVCLFLQSITKLLGR